MSQAPARPVRPLLVAVVAVAVLSLLAACGGGGSSRTAAPASASPSTATVACPTPATTTTAPGQEGTLVSGGLERKYYVWLPAGYTGTKPVPLVLDFHGTGETATSYEASFSPMSKDAPAAGYLLVAPQAVVGDASAIRWRVPGTGEKPDDVQFTADLIKQLESTYCIDPSRLYATGFSSGAGFTTYLGCQLDVWAAVAPMSGVSLVHPCPTRPPLAMITFHGTNDLFVMFHGLPGATSTTNPDGFYEGDVPTDVAAWATRNGCTGHVDTVAAPTVTKRTYTGCDPGADVVFYIIQGTGHTYPGGPRLSAAAASELGGQSFAIDAASVILSFFAAHQRTTPPNYTPQPEILASPTGAAASSPTAGAGSATSGGTTGGAAVPSTPFPTITVP